MVSGPSAVAVVGVQAPLWRGSHPLWRGLTRPLKGVPTSHWRGSQLLSEGGLNLSLEEGPSPSVEAA